MPNYFLWIKGMRGPTPVVLVDRSAPELSKAEKELALSVPLLLPEPASALDLKALAAIYPAPPPPTEETN